MRDQDSPLELYGQELGVGAEVAGYVVEKLSHRGPAATLYCARHRPSRKRIALKVLHLHLLAAAKPWKRFRQEIETLQRLRHPHIVRYLGSGELWDGRPYLAMEWLEGSSLEEQLKAAGPLTAREVWATAKQIGSALKAAHSHGIVHRDLKAENVMVLRRKTRSLVKLVDFGIAKQLEGFGGGEGLTSTGSILGTLSSMAPEQIRGESVDARADVYAFGILLYQMATGQLPFDASSRTELEEMHLYAPAPRASRLASFGGEFDRVIRRCLEKRPAFRFEGITELEVALRRSLLGQRGDRPSLALGLYVELNPRRARSVKNPSAVEAALHLVERHCQRGQLSIAVRAENALLAIAPLPRAPRQAQARRAKAVKTTVSLMTELKKLPAARSLRIGMRLHAAAFRPKGEIGEGELLALRRWTAPFAERLLVSDTAAEGIEGTAGFKRSATHSGFLTV